MRRLVFPLVAAAIAVASCNGTTGDALYTFNAYAAGAKGAGDPFTLDGYKVQLTQAQMYIGAVYVNEAPGGSGGTFNTPECIDSGVYCAQVPGGVEVNLLSTTPQPFSVQGSGSADLGLSWDLYLAEGDVNSDAINANPTHNIADLAGTATPLSGGPPIYWAATVNINPGTTEDIAGARGAPVESAGQPGLNPICLARILHLGGISLTLSEGVSMLLTIDPRAFFQAAASSFEPPNDFSKLPPIALPACQLDNTSQYPDSATVCIPDSSWIPGSEEGSVQGAGLYKGIFTGGNAAFSLSYTNSP